MKYLAFPLIIIFLISTAVAKEETYKDPRIGNRPLDYCLMPAQQCGKPAADRFCQLKNNKNAVRFQGVRSNQETWILGARTTCSLQKFDHCDRFAYIVCFYQTID